MPKDIWTQAAEESLKAPRVDPWTQAAESAMGTATVDLSSIAMNAPAEMWLPAEQGPMIQQQTGPRLESAFSKPKEYPSLVNEPPQGFWRNLKRSIFEHPEDPRLWSDLDRTEKMDRVIKLVGPDAIGIALTGRPGAGKTIIGGALRMGETFAGIEATRQVSKGVQERITGEDYGYEGAGAIAESFVFGAALSAAASGAKAAWKALSPIETSSALKFLGLKNGATDDEIRRAAQNLAKQHHPDKVKGHIDDFKEVIRMRDQALRERGLTVEDSDIVKNWRNRQQVTGGVAEPAATQAESVQRIQEAGFAPKQAEKIAADIQELQAQATETATPPAPLTPEQSQKVTATLAELEAANKAPVPAASVPVSPAPVQSSPAAQAQEPQAQEPQAQGPIAPVAQDATVPIGAKNEAAPAAITPEPLPPPPPLTETPPTPAETPDPSKTTSSRQADLEEDRKAMGLKSMNSKEKQSFEQWKTQAENEGIPDRAFEIASEVLGNPRPLTPVETAGMDIRMAQLKREHRSVTERLNAATDDAEILTLTEESERLESEYNVINNASDISGSEQGRALVSRQLTLDEDLSLIATLRKAQANKGKPISKEDRDALVRLTAKIDQANAEIADLKQQVNDIKAKGIIKEGGLKRYGKMNDAAKAAERDVLVGKVRDLLKAGCY